MTGTDIVAVGVLDAFDGFLPALAIDLVAILLLGFGIYYRRYRRQDLLFAYVCFNVGLFAVVRAFMYVEASPGIGLALGIGLFGALSIIRLRSEEISYAEVAFFFSALALAIVNGVGGEKHGFALTASAVVLAVMAAMEAFARRRPVHRLSLVFDHVLPDEESLRDELERRLGVSVVSLVVAEVDYVRDLMRLEVQCVPRGTPAVPPAPEVVLGAEQVEVGVER